jgi:hypothetical protein
VKLEEHVIVPVSTLAKGARYTKMWWLGWVVVSLLTLCVTFLCGMVVAHNKNKVVIDEALGHVDNLRAEVVKLSKTQITIWESQKQTLGTLNVALDFIERKEELRKANQGLVKERNRR